MEGLAALCLGQGRQAHGKGLGASGLVGPNASGTLAECATAVTLADQVVDGRVVPRPAMESDYESGSKGSSARHTNRQHASQSRTGNSDGDQVRLPGGRDVTRSATQLLPLLEEAPMAVDSCMGATSERWEKTPETRVTMVLEPLRKEVVTDADAERRDKPLNSNDESETNTDAQSEAMDPVLPTAGGTHRRTAV